MIVRTKTPADSRRPNPVKPRPTLRRRAMCQFIAMALFGSGIAHAATTPPAFSQAWFATKQPGATPPSATPQGNNGGNVSFTPGSALLQQRVQQSIQNLNNAAAAVAAQMQAQKDAQSAAQQLVSNVPDGLGKGGLTPSAGIGADPSLWQNANAPTDTVAGGKHTVEVKQTSQKAILTWDSFNVGRNTTVYFNQSSGNQSDGKNDWIALNRINDPSTTPSQILGQIKSEGSVYLLNRNGFLFGAGSQVNTHSLIASSLSLFSDDLKASNQQFIDGGVGTVGTLLTGTFTDGRTHDVVIEKGASITAGPEGFILIAAPNISNAGSIVADDGQAILAASTLLRNVSVNEPLSLYDPNQTDAQDTLINTGIVQARRGSVELHGRDIEQSGVLLSSTSISHPGTISIYAGIGQNLPSEKSFSTAGSVSFAPGSVSAILPEKDGSTTSSSEAADKAFVNGSISVLAGRVNLAGGSLIEAPGASVSLTAIRSRKPMADEGRVYIDNGATIDVSGLANVMLPMSALLVTIPRVGQNELANSPLLRNSFLYTQKNIVVDSSVSGTRADGLDWIGSPILNVAGYVENVPRDISQMLTKGGDITLDGNEVIARAGSHLALDGGYIAYQAGWITTPNLLGADGRIYNIADADPNVDYVGFAGQFTSNHTRWGISQTYNSPVMGGSRRWDSGFIDGADAGELTVRASDAVALDGDVTAQAFSGDREVVNGSQPNGGTFIFSDTPTSISENRYHLGVRLQESSLVLDDLVPGFMADTPWDIVFDEPKDNTVTEANSRDWMILSTDMIGKAGFAAVDITSSSAIVEAAGSTLAVQAGGTVSLVGSRIDVNGSIVAPAGTISLTTTTPQPAPGPEADPDVLSSADINIANGGSLSTRGVWVNDTGLSGTDRKGDRFINGGTISLSTQQVYLGDANLGFDGTGDIDIQAGAVLDVSGGGYVDTSGHVKMANGVPEGRGGDISIVTYTGGNDGRNFYGVIAPPPTSLHGGHIALDGSLLGFGFSGGGNLTLQAPEVLIGGNRDDLVNSDGLWLDPSFFRGQGFDNYLINSVTDATVAAGTHITVARSNLIANLGSLRFLQTGGDVYSPAVSSIGTLDPYRRWATRDARAGHGPGFSLWGGDYLSWDLVPANVNDGAPTYDGVTGSVQVDHGASIDVDARGTVSLRGTQATLVHGEIRAPGGSIDVGTRALNVGTPKPALTTRVWLGSDAILDASGISLIDPLAPPVAAARAGTTDGVVPRTGVVLDGGQINLESNSGYVIAEQGALLDVSGATDNYDLPVASARLNGATTDYLSSPVWSDGGSINMSAAAGLLSDATLRAAGGSAQAEGGSLSIGNEFISSRVVSYPQPTGIVVQQAGGFLRAGTDEMGEIEAGGASGVLHFAADSLVGSGIASLSLGNDGTQLNSGSSSAVLPIGFDGNVNIALAKSFVVTANVIEALPNGATTLNEPASTYASDLANVHISAPYVALLGIATSVAPRAGDGSLSIEANTIDIGGKLALGGWADASFAATGDIRFVAPAHLAYNAGNGAPITGVLSSTGNLTFQAAQIYPVTDYRFAVIANAAGIPDAAGAPRETTITVLPNGPSQTPLSAGGSLLLDADHIEQEGTIRVPSGSLVLGVSDPVAQATEFGLDSTYPLVNSTSVHLASGSLTSVSLDGLIVPYGSTIDGAQWRYNGSDTSQSADLAAPPSKQVALHGDQLALDEGATIDVSGGGSLQAGEWVPGVGGSRDVLAQRATVVSGSATSGAPQYADGRPVYAVMPGHQSSVASYDAAFATQGGDGPAVGQEVYLSGIPGLPAGYYTLLPAQYAELPGAYRIVQDTSATNSVLGRSARQADGSYAVTGFFGDALTGAHDSHNTTFLVQSRDVWTQYSQYTFTDADTYFGDKASKAGEVAPRLAADAGRLMLDAGSKLDLGLELTGEPAKGGRSSQVDIAAEAIQILGVGEQSKDGYLGVSADQLTHLGAGSLLIGGTRSTTAEGDLVTATADNVLLSNDAAHPLSGEEIMLVARGGNHAGATGIVLESGSSLIATGNANPVGSQPLVFGVNPGTDANGNATAAVAGDGSLLRVSQNGVAPVIRHQVTGFDGAAGTATGMLTIDAGAIVQGGSALTLDATGPMHASEDATFSAQAIDASANRIAFVGAGADGGDDGLVIGPGTLNLFRNANEVTLRSRSEMDFLGDLDISLDHSLTLNAGAMVGDGGNVTVEAARLGFGNALGAAQGDATPATGGRFDVRADEIDFGSGSTAMHGFSAFSATAAQGVVGEGSGGMDFGGMEVALNAPVFIADSGSNTLLKTTGAMRLAGTQGTALTRDALGGGLSLKGGSVDVGMNLQATAGSIAIQASQGDAHVGSGTSIDVAGVNRTFFDTKAFAPGGKLSIVSDHGAVSLDDGSSLKFGGGQDGGDAGSLVLNAAGSVNLNGTIDGHANAGYRGGYFTYATGGSADLDDLNNMAAGAGLTGLLSITSGSGDLALSAGNTLRAGKVYLYANGGNTRVDGTVDASGPVGGQIELYGRDGVDVEGRLLANSTIPEQRGGDVVIGTTGKGSQDQLDSTYGYELVQRADAGIIHIGANAQINVSGGSTAPIAGGRISFRAPLLADGDVPIQIDNARSMVGARDVTIEPFAVWSTADKSTNAAQHFDGIVDPAGWYTRDPSGKPVLVEGTWTDATGLVLDPPADDDELKEYLSKNYFTPKATNADHVGFYGYAGGDAASGPGTLMGFIEQPNFAFGGRYSPIANIHVRPGVELDNPADASGIDGGTIRILTNWNLGAGTTDTDGKISLAYRYGAQAPVLTFRAGGDIDIVASVSDGFYQQNTGAVLADPAAPPAPPTPPAGDNGYGDAVLAYQESLQYMDSTGLWNDGGTVNMKVGTQNNGGSPDGTTISLSSDPNWQPLQAPLKDQSANYYANYERYIDEVGTDTNQKWAFALNDVNFNSLGFLSYAPNSAGAPDPAAFPVYADYVSSYESWLESTFRNVRGARETTPVPLMQPLDGDYNAYSANYGTYIDGHFNYYNYVYTSVGNSGFGTQLFYAPFAPRSNLASSGDPAYDKALASYQVSLSYMDTMGVWNDGGTVNMKVGTQNNGGSPDGTTISLSSDPNWQPLQAPLKDQSANYYTNYNLYIGEIGDGDTNPNWAFAFNDVNVNSLGFLSYAPNSAGAPDPAAFPLYADYVSTYEGWLESTFRNVRGSRETTPVPLMQPLTQDYSAYTTDYSTYINGHFNYYNYVYTSVGNSGFGTQLFYAPFAPRSDLASSGNPAYDKALASYQSSLSYMDTTGVWNDGGTVNMKVGTQSNGGSPAGTTISLSSDPNWQPLQAPLKNQSPNYYTNYNLYIGDIGDGDANPGWAFAFNDVNSNSLGFLSYSPNGTGAPDATAFPAYADYVSAYETWLESTFRNVRGSRETTPIPLMQPLAQDYSVYTTDYSTYITGHFNYYNYVYTSVGNSGFGSQLFYAPFAPRSDAGLPGSGTTVPIPVAAANNSPSNMPSLGNPVPFASATLMGGSSSSLRFVAGADLSSADPLAVETTGLGNVTLDGHFEVKDTLTDRTVIGDPRSPFAGKTLLFPTTIRTGTGSIDIASAGDVRWLDDAAPTAIYTAGQPTDGTTTGTDVAVVRPSVVVLSGIANTIPDMLVSGMVNPDGAGDITMSAGGNIDAIQNPVDPDGNVTKGSAGDSIAQYWWQWMQTGNAADGSRSSINFSNFAQGIMSVGGNVSVDAGGDISELSVSLPTTWYANANRDAVTTVGGGNLDVHAGGDILSGAYFVARGVGRIMADGAVQTAPELAAMPFESNGRTVTTPVSTIIALQDASVTVDARTGLDVGGVYNPSYLKGSFFASLLPAGHADNQPYSSDSSIELSTTIGDLAFGSLKAPGTIFGAEGGIAGPVLPATVSMTAFDGGIDVMTDGALYPSATGNLTMLATGDIGFSRQTFDDSRTTVFGLIDKSAEGDSPLKPILNVGISFDENGDPSAQHDQNPLHGDDDQPVRIYSLNGDITDGITAPNGFNYLSLVIAPAKQALIYAGRDIVNLAFIGQHTHDADITRIAAGRDIYDTPLFASGGLDNYIPNGYVYPGQLLLGGPGNFLVEAGRDIGPLTNQAETSGNSQFRSKPTGIQSIGNLYNAFLPHEGADVNVAFGVGPGVDTAAFLARYLDNANPVDGFGSVDTDLVDFMERRAEGTVIDTGYANDKIDVSLTVEEARAMLAQEPEYVQRLFAEQVLFKILNQVGRDYNAAGNPFEGQYKRGFAAIDTLFPSTYGYTANGAGEGGLNGTETPISTGNLDIRSTSIQTQQGGDVTIVGPGGQALVGSTAAPSQITDANGNVIAGPNTMGILTLEKGNINVFTDRSVLLAQSRIFTEQGGDLVIWSSNGDINAGQGAKTTAEIPPPVYVCNIDAWCRIDARGQVSGAGIATLQTVEGAPPGSVALIAPRGTVDAGDAGIRVSGDIVIAAARVLNADNIQVKGESLGIPVVAAVNVGALNAASAAASAATKAAEDVARKQQSDARDRVPSIISVNVLRDGNNGASVTSPDAGSAVNVIGAGHLDNARASLLTPEERKNLR